MAQRQDFQGEIVPQRIQSYAVWETTLFAPNVLAFLFISLPSFATQEIGIQTFWNCGYSGRGKRMGLIQTFTLANEHG